MGIDRELSATTVVLTNTPFQKFTNVLQDRLLTMGLHEVGVARLIL